MKVQYIEVNRIVEDPEQPRKHHSDESLRGLADSIRQHGMLNPITVSPVHSVNQFRLVTGERRWRAAAMAGLDAVPCLVKEVADDERLTEQLIENLQREDLQPLEKAKGIHHVRATLNLTNREIAQRLGLSERAVAYLLDLLALPAEIGEAVVSRPNRPADGDVTEKHARFLKQLNDTPELQSAVVERIRGRRLSSEDTGSLVKALRRQPDRADEILDSTTDQLVQFHAPSFERAGPCAADLDETRRIVPYAQRIVDFLPCLSGIDPAGLTHPELRQVEDALTSLQLAVQGLLRSCKVHLAEPV